MPSKPWSIERLPGNFRYSTMTENIGYSEMEIPAGGFITPCAAHSWSLLWAAPWTDKSLSTWCPRAVCTLGCQSPRERSRSVRLPGWETTPRRTHRRKRLHVLFELWRGRVCLLAARVSALWRGSAPLSGGKKKELSCSQKEESTVQSVQTLAQLTQNAIHV